MTIGPSPACLACLHFHESNGEGLTCDAFPAGIPDLILVEGNPHTKPVQGDHGIRFEPRKPKEKP